MKFVPYTILGIVSRSTHAESFTWSNDINPIARGEICECLECVRSLFLCETHAGSLTRSCRETRKCDGNAWANRPAFHPENHVFREPHRFQRRVFSEMIFRILKSFYYNLSISFCNLSIEEIIDYFWIIVAPVVHVLTRDLSLVWYPGYASLIVIRNYQPMVS